MADLLDELRAAVIAAPDDDEPRRVYADALLERGDPRGELINLECMQVGAPAEEVRARAWELRNHALSQLRARWPDGRSQWTFRRGFVDELQIDGEAFVRYGDAIVAAEPVRTLTLTRCEGHIVPSVAALPALARIRRLRFEHGSMGLPGLTAVLRSPHLRRVETLELVGCDLRASAGTAFGCASPSDLPRLRRLGLERNALHDPGVAAIAGTAIFAQLETLDLTRTQVGDAGLQALLPRGTKLERLSVAGAQLGPAGIDALAALPALTVVDIRDTRVQPPSALARLAASRTLEVVRCFVPDLPWLEPMVARGVRIEHHGAIDERVPARSKR